MTKVKISADISKTAKEILDKFCRDEIRSQGYILDRMIIEYKNKSKKK